jgi:outer membrane immunogenic protein
MDFVVCVGGHMRFLSFHIASVALVGLTQIASAADMPIKAPIAAPPIVPQNWTGFYLGANVGGAWTNDPTQSEFDISGPGGTPSFFPNSFRAHNSNIIGGVHGGYNWQFAPTWLLGLEADFDWTNLKAEGGVSPMIEAPQGVAGALSAYTSSVQIENIGSVRGRIGYIWNTTWMAYLTGGFAWGHVKYNGSWISVGAPNPPCCQAPVSFSDTRTGWVLGGGLEYKPVGSPWIFGVEYLFYDINTGESRGSPIVSANGAPLPPLPNPACVTSSCIFYSWNNLTVQTARARVSYKF